MRYLKLLFFITAVAIGCGARAEVEVGASKIADYKPMLAGKKIALLSNHTGMVGSEHTLDLMLRNGLNVTTIFSPEHGFRGTADAGEHIAGGVDAKTGIPIASLYDGRTRMPAKGVMDNIDVIVVDIQDVGLRFYTYYCTMVDLMNAAARYGKDFMVLDRPNPNGMTVDGPVLDMKYASGVGRLPIPTLHGMTLGELALMANGEGWLKDGKKVNLSVIPCTGYTHSTRYRLPIPPSPNLPDMKAVYMYPSTCYFEATPVSLGRGTDTPFTIYGHPNMKCGDFYFTPTSRSGAKNPPQLGKRCRGRNLRAMSEDEMIGQGVNFEYVIDAYNCMGKPADFFTSFFELLAGNAKIRKMIENGASAEEIRASWSDEVKSFKTKRKPYLLYPES